jgi:hypothetical protein
MGNLRRFLFIGHVPDLLVSAKQHWHEQGHQNGDDGDNTQQLDQGEGRTASTPGRECWRSLSV